MGGGCSVCRGTGLKMEGSMFKPPLQTELGRCPCSRGRYQDINSTLEVPMSKVPKPQKLS